MIVVVYGRCGFSSGEFTGEEDGEERRGGLVGVDVVGWVS